MGGQGRTEAVRVTLQRLAELAPSAGEEKYACVAKITNLTTTFDWYYMSCPECHRKAKMNADKSFTCMFARCPRTLVVPIEWYRFGVQVVDQTGEAEFVFLGKYAELAVGISAAGLAEDEKKNPGREDAPSQLVALIGKRFMFSITVKHLGGDTSRWQYTVSRVDPVPPYAAPLQGPASSSSHNVAAPPMPPVVAATAPVKTPPSAPLDAATTTDSLAADRKLKRVASDDSGTQGGQSSQARRKLIYPDMSHDEPSDTPPVLQPDEVVDPQLQQSASSLPP